LNFPLECETNTSVGVVFAIGKETRIPFPFVEKFGEVGNPLRFISCIIRHFLKLVWRDYTIQGITSVILFGPQCVVTVLAMWLIYVKSSGSRMSSDEEAVGDTQSTQLADKKAELKKKKQEEKKKEVQFAITTLCFPIVVRWRKEQPNSKNGKRKS
jgi:hypothetical protein